MKTSYSVAGRDRKGGGTWGAVQAPRARTVVIVDDDEQLLHLLGRWVREAGMQVVTCRTFEDARRHLDAQVPDVLLTDIRLEGFNGLELIIKTVTKCPAVSTFVLTAFDDPVLRREAESLGACFLVKPISRQELLAAVTSVSPSS